MFLFLKGGLLGHLLLTLPILDVARGVLVNDCQLDAQLSLYEVYVDGVLLCVDSVLVVGLAALPTLGEGLLDTGLRLSLIHI